MNLHNIFSRGLLIGCLSVSGAWGDTLSEDFEVGKEVYNIATGRKGTVVDQVDSTTVVINYPTHIFPCTGEFSPESTTRCSRNILRPYPSKKTSNP